MDSTLLYGLYILIWPAITLGVLVLICTATYRDIKKAQRNNKDIIQSLKQSTMYLCIYKSSLGIDLALINK